MSVVGKSKEYDSEIVASFMSDLFLEHKKYQNRMLQLECEFERYEANDTHRGKAAEASKEYIREGEKRFQYEILDANSMLLHLYDHMRDMFSSIVDSHPRAKIKTNVLLEIERHYKNYYHDVKESGDDIETRARAIESKFGKYGKVTIPDFEPSKMAYKKFCGGDSENSGYLYECIDKFVRFDRDECGIYRGDGYIKECATDMNLHMTIQVDYADGTKSEVWSDDTWWITDFNPKKLFYDEDDIDATVVKYTIDMSFLSEQEWDRFLLANELDYNHVNVKGRVIEFTL